MRASISLFERGAFPKLVYTFKARRLSCGKGEKKNCELFKSSMLVWKSVIKEICSGKDGYSNHVMLVLNSVNQRNVSIKLGWMLVWKSIMENKCSLERIALVMPSYLNYDK